MSATEDESIAHAVARLRTDLPFRDEYGSTNMEVLEVCLEQHNRSKEFIKIATEVYQALEMDIKAESVELGIDGTPAIRLTSCNRIGTRWAITGDCAAEYGSLRIFEQEEYGIRGILLSETEATIGSRWKWTADIALQITPV